MNPVKKAMKVLPHVSIVMAGMMIVFFLIDRVNQPMGFMTNEFHRWLSLFLSLFCLGYSVLLIAWQRRQERYEEQKRLRAMQARRSETARSGKTPARQKASVMKAQGTRPAQPRPAPAKRPEQTGRTMQGRF